MQIKRGNASFEIGKGFRTEDTDFSLSSDRGDVTLFFRDDEYTDQAVITMTPSQAREMAEALEMFAERAERIAKVKA